MLLALPGTPALAVPRDRSSINEAIEVLDELAMSPERCVPPALLRDASAVVIAPNLLKGGLVVAARHGHGMLLVREKDGGWSNPVFITMTGGSVGLQLGIQKSDVFLVIRNARSLDRLMRGAGKLTLGADASVAAGPLGRQVSADTDAMLRAEILSYSRSRGIFAGVAIEGDTIRIDETANDLNYGKKGVTVAEIMGYKVAAPEPAAVLRAKLTQLAGIKVEQTPRTAVPPTYPPLPPLPPAPPQPVLPPLPPQPVLPPQPK